MRNYAIRPFTRVFGFLTKLYFRFTLTTKFDGGNAEKLLLLLNSYGFYISNLYLFYIYKEIFEKFILIRYYIENV